MRFFRKNVEPEGCRPRELENWFYPDNPEDFFKTPPGYIPEYRQSKAPEQRAASGSWWQDTDDEVDDSGPR